MTAVAAENAQKLAANHHRLPVTPGSPLDRLYQAQMMLRAFKAQGYHGKWWSSSWACPARPSASGGRVCRP